ncbi:MAG: hypothetical protein QM499_01180 [Flavobacteriaceae bacterium]
MKTLNINTQGVKGGQTKSFNIGYLLATFENQRISIDNFEGTGNSYKPRKEPLIQIIEDGKNLFEGTFEELKNKLK